MPDSLDLATHLLHVSGGRVAPVDPPGFLSLAPPRKAARGREKDYLFLCLGLSGREAAPPEAYDTLLDLAAATFYGSPGSVTSALRQALAAANQKLLDDNLAAGQAGGTAPLQGGLLGAALRGSDFYSVVAGPGLLLVARPTGHERFPHAPTRPLGLSNTVEALYFHTALSEGEYVCLSSAPARGWTDIALVGLGNLAGLPAVVERLREASGGEAVALVGRFESVPAHSVPLGPSALQRPAPQPKPEVPPVEAPRAEMPPALARRQPVAQARPEPPAGRAARGAGLAEFFRLRPRAPRRPLPEAEPNNGTAPEGEAEVGEFHPTIEAGAEPPEVFWSAPAPANPPAGPEPLPDLPQFLAERGTPAAVPPRDPAAAGAEPADRAGPLAAPAQRLFRSMGRAVGVTLAEAIRGLRMLAARTLPEGTLQKDGLFIVPTSVQIGIALLIPVVVVGVSVWLYLENGRAAAYDAALNEAQWAVARGRASPDTLTGRPHWESALNWLVQAETLRPGQPEVAALRQEAQARLDELDWVSRLDYQPLLLAGLGRAAQLTKLVLVGPDIYALDQGQNRVWRLMPIVPGATGDAAGSAAGTYTMDASFQCSGNQTLRDTTIGDLIDVALVPGQTVVAGDATLTGDVVVALDSLGALLYCAPGLETPYASYLTAPEVGWKRPTAMEFYADRLYLLDPGGSEIWQYQASGGAFLTPPMRYFTSVSYDLADTVEFAIAGGEVFLLRRDGRVANCTRNAPGATATCSEVVQYTDPRPGRATADVLAGLTRPLALSSDPPPEPSLYLLDGGTSGIYQLSLKLVLVGQFRPYFPLAGPISAIAIDPAKRFFAAAGDNVYLAPRP